MRHEHSSKPVVTRTRWAVLASTILAGVCSTTVAFAGGPTTGQIRSSLEHQLAPPGKIGMASLLKRGGVTYPFKALAAGNAEIEWIVEPPRPNKRKLQAVIVASGQTTFSRSGTRRMKLVLTNPEGTYLLRTAKKSVKLTAWGVFTTKTGKSIRARRTVVLGR